jgi:hypothetical protein
LATRFWRAFAGVDIMMLIYYPHDVRTTLTLDEDVRARLQGEMRRSGRSFKDVVNDCLRRGIEGIRSAPGRKPFKIQARPLGVQPGLDYDNVTELLERIEGPAAR